MKPHYLDEQIIKDRQQRRMHEAQHHRLVREAQGNRPGLTGRFLIGVGRWMVAGGMRLQSRYEAANIHLNRHNTAKADVYYLANR